MARSLTDCLDLDRASPRRRPDRPAAGTQRWRELLFVHWSFDSEIVRALVPKCFELDLWKDRAFVGLVPFRMEATRTSWMPKRAGLEFLETNLRTYVVHNGEPGVFFFSLEAASWLAVRAARILWTLPYFHADMHASRACDDHGVDRVAYRSHRLVDDGAIAPSLEVSYEIGENLGPSNLGTLEYFLLERYFLFCEKRARGASPEEARVLRGQVHHTPYPAKRAKLVSLRETLTRSAGLFEGGKLETVHFSEGVDVEVFGPDVVDGNLRG